MVPVVTAEAVDADEAALRAARLRALENTSAVACPPPVRIRTSHEARYCPVMTFGPGRPLALRWMRTRSSIA